MIRWLREELLHSKYSKIVFKNLVEILEGPMEWLFFKIFITEVNSSVSAGFFRNLKKPQFD